MTAARRAAVNAEAAGQVSRITLTKVYFSWTGPRGPYAIAAGFKKTRTGRYVFGYFAGGAEAALANA